MPVLIARALATVATVFGYRPLRVPATPSGISSSTGIAASAVTSTAPSRAGTHSRRMNLGPNANIPASVQRRGIDGNDTVLVRQLVEARQPRDVVGILIQAVQNDDYGIVLVRDVSSGQPHNVSAIHIVDIDGFLGFLGARSS